MIGSVSELLDIPRYRLEIEHRWTRMDYLCAFVIYEFGIVAVISFTANV